MEQLGVTKIKDNVFLIQAFNHLVFYLHELVYSFLQMSALLIASSLRCENEIEVLN